MVVEWTPIQHTHLTDRVYAAVRDRILSRALKTDEQISVIEVAEELGVSRTPVVDAVKRLATEGLVEVRARRGTFVRGLTEQDVREVFELRQALEVFALRSVIQGGAAAALAKSLDVWVQTMARLITDNDFNDYPAFIEADRAFHATIVGANGNSRANAIYDNLNVHMHVARSHLFRNLEPPHRVHADHQEIVEAVRSADGAAAEAALSRHLHGIQQKMVENVGLNGGCI